MDKYIIVRVGDATSVMPPETVVMNGKVIIPTTPVAHIRKAIHTTAELHFLGIADMVTNTDYMTKEESEEVARIFEGALARVKKRRSDGSSTRS